MKTKEELNALKEEAENLNRKLHELTDDEFAQVFGGLTPEELQKTLRERKEYRNDPVDIINKILGNEEFYELINNMESN